MHLTISVHHSRVALGTIEKGKLAHLVLLHADPEKTSPT